ncbi:MAG TPA: hypothetical protein VLV49_19085 [Terriglobales bacterium]|nr:hypothetical protein [Terriglobales bacterium]
MFLAAAVAVFARAQASETGHHRERMLPIASFYDAPRPLPAGQPGTLIRSEKYDDYELPYQFTVKRILYHSRSASGRDVAASGVVVIPPGKAPGGGWPLIAWAHDFTGAARQCAPSLMRNVGSGPVLAMYARLGYAVVATDYTGLGTSFANAGADLPSNATDVIYSVAAALAAVPQVGRRWLAMGKGEGALVAVKVDEEENEVRDANYLGSVALSGVADLKQIYGRPGGSAPGTFSLAHAVKAVYPGFDLDDMLTKKGMSAYAEAEKGCSGIPAGEENSSGELLKPDWETNQFIEQFFQRNAFGQKPAFGPLLVISGGTNPEITSAMIEATVASMCKQGDRVQWYDYPGVEAGELIGASVRDPIAWIQGRFAGRPAPSSCH